MSIKKTAPAIQLSLFDAAPAPTSQPSLSEFAAEISPAKLFIEDTPAAMPKRANARSFYSANNPSKASYFKSQYPKTEKPSLLILNEKQPYPGLIGLYTMATIENVITQFHNELFTLDVNDAIAKYSCIKQNIYDRRLAQRKILENAKVPIEDFNKMPIGTPVNFKLVNPPNATAEKPGGTARQAPAKKMAPAKAAGDNAREIDNEGDVFEVDLNPPMPYRGAELDQILYDKVERTLKVTPLNKAFIIDSNLKHKVSKYLLEKHHEFKFKFFTIEDNKTKTRVYKLKH